MLLVVGVAGVLLMALREVREHVGHDLMGHPVEELHLQVQEAAEEGAQAVQRNAQATAYHY